MWDLRSSTRDWTCTSCIRRQGLTGAPGKSPELQTLNDEFCFVMWISPQLKNIFKKYMCAWAQEFWAVTHYAYIVSTLNLASISWPLERRGPPGCLRRGELAQVRNSRSKLPCWSVVGLSLWITTALQPGQFSTTHSKMEKKKKRMIWFPWIKSEMPRDPGSC